jgi:hypothetical protein
MSKKYSLSTNQISTALSDKKVILNYDKGEYYSLNEVGAFIWDELKTTSLSMEQIIDKVIDAFEVTRNNCEKDIIELLEDLEKEKLLGVSEM